MAYQIGTDTNFKDIYVEEKTPAQIRFENACKKIFVNQCGVTALIDSGSELNLMCTELYAQLGSPQGMKTATNLVGLGGSIVSTEKFKASVLLDGHEYEVTFYVVPRHAMPYSVILGQEFLKDVFTIMSNGSILIAPNMNKWLSKISCVVSHKEYVLGNIMNKQVQQEVIECVKSYNPVQIKEAPIELRIVLKDDIPIAQRPRRISLAEQQLVEKQVAEWLKDGIIRALQRLKQVLAVASEYGLQINWKKAQLLCRRIEYLGHVIEDGKVQPSSEKTDAVTRYPEPKTLKQLHSFIGLTSYFRKYIKDYALIAKPLTDLLRKDSQFEFNDTHRCAFNILKKALASSPVLRIYDPQLQTELHTDASAIAYSAILLQKDYSGELHPVHYYSRKTSDAEKKYSSYELEALAVIEGVKKFRHYLFGNHFKIVTDCQAFQKTLNKKDLSTRVARWVMLLEEYDYVIEHRPGSKMQHADALSRNPFIGTIELSLHEQVKQAQLLDDGLKAIIEILKLQPFEDYSYSDGLLYKGQERSIDKDSIPLHTIHCDHIGPLSETRKMYNYILTVVDAFTKFVWLFPVKSTTNRGTAFTSKDFKEYCDKEHIQHITITTGVPRGNGQVERIHRIIISVLTKLCIEEPSHWYKQVSRVQRALNSTYQRSIDTTPFELMVGTKMKTKEDLHIYELIQNEQRNNFIEERENLKIKAKEQIQRVQDENCRTYNRKRKESTKYAVGDIVAIRRTQFGPCLKLKPKYLGPYRVTKVKRNDRYDLEKIDHMTDGPRLTSSSADYMKPWPLSSDIVELGE
ncbi:uncharacterized protein LOC135117217 [Helicoverpa armigera]|uniref:uncharacterized protein LOC135117217 n=1 Tax=Helicoverpa armigera TaxID=29058 RepID=UPI0030831C82